MNPDEKIRIIDVVALGQTNDVKTLIKEGLDVNELDEHGNHPTVLAASRNDFETLKVLISAGSSVNVLDRAGQSPLYWAQTHNNAAMIKLINESMVTSKLKTRTN